MGQAASAELRTAQATISTLTKDLAAARSTLAVTEATVQQAKSEAVVRGAQSVGSQLVDGVIARQALELRFKVDITAVTLILYRLGGLGMTRMKLHDDGFNESEITYIRFGGPHKGAILTYPDSGVEYKEPSQ